MCGGWSLCVSRLSPLSFSGLWLVPACASVVLRMSRLSQLTQPEESPAAEVAGSEEERRRTLPRENMSVFQFMHFMYVSFLDWCRTLVATSYKESTHRP